MLSKSVLEALNDQIAKEFFAAHLYLSMAAFFEDRNLPGFARWMRMQNQEEVGHAMRLFDFVIHNGGRVILKEIPEPQADFADPLAVMEKALEHERHVTTEIHKLYELTLKEKAYATQLEMQWFINEQVEEERTVSDILARLKLVGDSPSALLFMDKELGARTAAS